MKIFNETPLTVAWLVTSVTPPNLLATFVVKGTFRMRPGQAVEPLPVGEGDSPTGDLHDDDDPEKALRYSTDFAPNKLRADVLLVGTCHAPGGTPTPACPVTFRVGSWSKTLAVIGERIRRRKLLGYSTPEPEPFTRMRIGFENTYGGPGFPENPLGKGHSEELLPDGSRALRAPNIQYADRLVGDAISRPEPAFLGPIPSTWPQRKPRGTYGEKWLNERWPWFPADFDWSHFNAAPADQQIEGYLRGDEEIVLENLHPEHGRYVCRLPSIRPGVFVAESSAAEGLSWRRVDFRLDTLWVDVDAEKLVLLWRGLTPARNLKMTEVAELHVCVESLAEPPESVEDHLADLARRAAEEKEAEEREAARREAERRELEEEIARFDEQVQAATKEAEERRAAAEKQLGERGIALTREPAGMADLAEKINRVRAENAERFPGFADQLRIPITLPEMEGADPDWTRERCEAHAQAKKTFAGLDLSGVDLSDLTLSNLDFSEADLTGCSLVGADLSGANLTRAGLRGADLSGADLSGALLEGADLSKACLRGSRLSGAKLDRATLSNAMLAEANLEGAAANFADFASVDLSAATLKGGSFERTDFSESNLERTDLREAVLRESIVEEAKGPGVNMEGADLTGLHAGNAPDFSRGNFRKVKASESFWEGALLDGADFRSAGLRMADFTSASLVGAVLEGADLREARFEDADLEKASLVFANVFRGSFERAALRDADMRQANLYEAELWDAITDGTLLEGANLKMTKLA